VFFSFYLFIFFCCGNSLEFYRFRMFSCSISNRVNMQCNSVCTNKGSFFKLIYKCSQIEKWIETLINRFNYFELFYFSNEFHAVGNKIWLAWSVFLYLRVFWISYFRIYFIYFLSWIERPSNFFLKALHIQRKSTVLKTFLFAWGNFPF
jgi:hypothetical protein